MALENFLEMRDTVRDPKFMLRNELSFELESRHPQRFIPRYSMVMFHHEIPYRVAFERGRVQGELLARLTEEADSLAGIPVAQMDALVTELLDPLPFPPAAGSLPSRISPCARAMNGCTSLRQCQSLG